MAKIVNVFELTKLNTTFPTVLPEDEIFGKSKEFWHDIADEMVLMGVMNAKFGQDNFIDGKICHGPRIASASLFLRHIMHNWNEYFTYLHEFVIIISFS